MRGYTWESITKLRWKCCEGIDYLTACKVVSFLRPEMKCGDKKAAV